MSELTNIFSMLDRYVVGESIFEFQGVSCYRVIHKTTKTELTAKIISIPPTPKQATALMLTGICKDREEASAYFKSKANAIIQEIKLLRSLSEQEGFVPYTEYQMASLPNGLGYAICLLGNHYNTLDKALTNRTLSDRVALNCGIDLCSALTTCRRSGYLFVNLKPEGVHLDADGVSRIGDLGFIPLDSLSYTSLPEYCISDYTPPEIQDAFSALNTTMDVYAVGLILYQAYNNGVLPFNSEVKPSDMLPAPANADADLCAIILKACAVNPEDRWESPMELGQALIRYMQDNSVSDTPIAPTETADNETGIGDGAMQYGEDENGNLNFIGDMEQTAETTIAVHEEISEETATQEDLQLESDVQETIEEVSPAPDSPKTKKAIWPYVAFGAIGLALIIGIILLF